ncbi:hypothetical protein [Ureibacillus sp. FSL W8-0352]|uniref:hypothetical protein n=1 Tax=Ureibacillus sp. FSL W8-0352 TaxID=2954596 RepID=UPI0030F65E80
MLSLSIILAACGNDSSKTQENNDSSSSTENVDTTENQEAEKVEIAEKKEEPKISTINAGEPAEVTDFAEITVQKAVFGKVINPPNPDSFYSYYKNSEADETFLDTVIAVKSLLTSGRSADEFVNVKIVYDNKYEYLTFSTIEEGGGSDFTYTNITSIEPLNTGIIHYIASVPTQVETDGKPLKAVITVNGETFEYVIR